MMMMMDEKPQEVTGVKDDTDGTKAPFTLSVSVPYG